MYILKLNSKEIAALSYALILARRDYKKAPDIFAEDIADVETLLQMTREAGCTVEEEHNDPLTQDELRAMDGEPVWCVDSRGKGYWVLINVDEDIPDAFDCQGEFLNGGLYEYEWLAYRRKPRES